MECCKWEETGLLYAAGELVPELAAGYEKHLGECGYCREELDAYRSDRKNFFTEAVLGEVPSAEVDAEILRVCSDLRPKVRISAPALFAVFFRRQVVVPALLFMAGFISFGYIMVNRENARQMAAAQERNAVVQSIAVQAAQQDSLKDSVKNDTEQNFAGTRGNLNDRGVVTVDLKK